MIGNRIVTLALMMFGFGALLAQGSLADHPFRVTSGSSDKIVLELNSPAPLIEKERFNGAEYDRISMEGAEPSAEEGCPELPVYAGMVAIPENARYTISYEYSGAREIPNITPKPVSGDSPKGSVLSAAYFGNARYPAEQVTASGDAYLRDFRVLPLQACSLSWDPAENMLTHYGSIRVTIDLSYPETDSGPVPYTSCSQAFGDLYEAQILNFADYRNLITAPRNARVLIIHGEYNNQTFLSKLNEFVTWKRQKGFEVDVASTAVAGNSNTAIKSYIQSRYDNYATRPDFIILVGDVSGSFAVPTWFETDSGYNGEGDYPYTYLNGPDMLGDAFIGRISAEDVSQLAAMFSKVYACEKNLNVNLPGAAWLDRMLIIGDPTYSGRSCVYVGQYVHEIAEYANPDFTFIENYSSSGYVSTINGAINQGVGFFSYRGYYGVSGWAPSSSIANGIRLPHAVILTCETGSFAGTSMSEEFTRMGTESVPAGAASCISMATPGTHTLFNNALSAGIWTGVFTYGMRTMGEALLNGRLYLNAIYGASQPNYVKSFAHWCNLMGDPTLEAWVSIPNLFAASAPATIPAGTAILEIGVGDAAQNPVEGACVTAYNAVMGEIVAKAFTGPDGVASLNLPPGLASELLITISRHEYRTEQFTVAVDAAGSVTYASHQVIDNGSGGSSGNADGTANATETIALQVEIRNNTTSLASGLSASLSTDNPHVQISAANSGYPDLASGASATGNTPFVLSLDAGIAPLESVRFVLNVTGANGLQHQSVLRVDAVNARLNVSNYSVLDGANGILDPGEIASLSLQIANSSAYHALDLTGELSSLNNLIGVTDSLSYFGAVPATSQAGSVDGFQLHALDQLIPGMQVAFRLRLYNANGFEQECLFNIPVGSVSQNTPLGPDEFGYLIYDETDIGFPECPVYEWVEIAPALGGNGTLVPDLADSGSGSTEGDTNSSRVLKVIDLPFMFPYYGIYYSQITVCVNGFIAFGATNDGDYRNARLPGGQGPSPMIAPFWDDLYLASGSCIYQFNDVANHRFIVQYHNLKNGYDNTSVEAFQVIFYDPLIYPTGLGQGKIKIQYKTFNNVDAGSGGLPPVHGNYCTIGIKDHSNTRGLEYTFNNSYPPAAAPLGNEKAILISTVPTLYLTAHLLVERLIINDGNGNGTFEPGEIAELGIALKNDGLATATDVNVVLSTNSPFVSVEPGTSDYPDIAGNSSGVNHIPFGISVSQDCPGGTVASLQCEVSAAGGSWSYPMSITILKPEIELTNTCLIDEDGNGNGILEPGENPILVVNLKNVSNLRVDGLTCTMACTDPNVTLLDGAQYLFGIPPHSICQAAYRLSLSESAALGSNLMFSFTYQNDQLSAQTIQIPIRIGAVGLMTDFESSNGNFVPSPSSNAWQWGTSQAAGSHSGTKVWGTLLNQQYPAGVTWTLTSPTLYISGNYALDFWHFFDTENASDGGNVKISANGSPWSLLTPAGGYPSSSVAALGGPGFSGMAGWSLAHFDLSTYANQNVRFRWTFASDGVNQGQGWFIDDVTCIGMITLTGLLSGDVMSGDSQPAPVDAWVSNQSGITAYADVGQYKLYLPFGSHSVTASAPGYQPDSVSSLVLNDDENSLYHEFQLIEFKGVSSFSHNHTDDAIQLSWMPPDEPYFTPLAYRVMRRVNAGAFEPAQESAVASYNEVLSVPGIYRYYVQVLYAEGESLPSQTYSVAFPFSGNQEEPPVPQVTRLLGNYPNPFNPETTISFELASPGRAVVSIFNLRGQLVKTLWKGDLSAGNHRFVWDGRDLTGSKAASGVYFYRLEHLTFSDTRKMLLMK